MQTIHTHTHTHTHTVTHMHTHTYCNTHTHTRARARARTQWHTQWQTHTHVRTHARTHTHTHTSTHAHTHKHAHTLTLEATTLSGNPLHWLLIAFGCPQSESKGHLHHEWGSHNRAECIGISRNSHCACIELKCRGGAGVVCAHTEGILMAYNRCVLWLHGNCIVYSRHNGIRCLVSIEGEAQMGTTYCRNPKCWGAGWHMQWDVLAEVLPVSIMHCWEAEDYTM